MKKLQRKSPKIKLYFSDFFEIDPKIIEDYGAFNISLVNDLPLFVDPFLLFTSEKKEYQQLHDKIIAYVTFLKDVSQQTGIQKGLLKSWFNFSEIRQNWLGYSKVGNNGSGLGTKFARALHENLHNLFSDFGKEKISKASHLEKLCLIHEGVGKDNISDLTVNLIKKFLLNYTQEFTINHIKPEHQKIFNVPRVEFNYSTRTWVSKKFTLPEIGKDFILLTPKDILSKDEAWINKTDMVHEFDDILGSMPNEQLRAQINDYFVRMLPEDANKKEYTETVIKVVKKFPVYIDYFIKNKEGTGKDAKIESAEKVKDTEFLFIQQVRSLASELQEKSNFYSQSGSSYEESHARLLYLKQVIENNDGYRFFYSKGRPIVKNEHDLQILFRLTWYGTSLDVNSEVNNGRGPVDYKISRGSQDKTLVEFKLARNKKLKQNLLKQILIYEAASETNNSIKAIIFFTDQEHDRLISILKELNISEGKNLVIIDARPDKISASNVK
jgi:hypothetical protein